MTPSWAPPNHRSSLAHADHKTATMMNYMLRPLPATHKYQWSMKGFGPTIAAFLTENHELHRIRAASLAPFFSKASNWGLPFSLSLTNLLHVYALFEEVTAVST